MNKSLFLASALIIIPCLASAKEAYLQLFESTYPYSKTASFKCNICHAGGVKQLNYYGIEFERADYQFTTIEALDSDGDGVSNIDEINIGTNPGDKTSL